MLDTSPNVHDIFPHVRVVMGMVIGLGVTTLLSGVAPGAWMELPRVAMEQTFERLAAVAEGRPVALEGLPETPEFAAALLILREFMHHLGFSAIHVGV